MTERPEARRRCVVSITYVQTLDRELAPIDIAGDAETFMRLVDYCSGTVDPRDLNIGYPPGYEPSGPIPVLGGALWRWTGTIRLDDLDENDPVCVGEWVSLGSFLDVVGWLERLDQFRPKVTRGSPFTIASSVLDDLAR